MNIDKRKNYYLGLDTETCNGIMRGNRLDLTNSLVYDLGIAIVDKKGNIYESYSFVIYEIFCKMKDVMQSAYYANKLPQYEREIQEGKRKIVSIYTAQRTIRELYKKYNITAIFAHNARFDYNALNQTLRYVSKSKDRYFTPYGIVWYDTLKMSHDTIAQRKDYKRYCEANNYMTNHKTPRPRETAEILFRFLTRQKDFVESHTGLEDVLIETVIFSYCITRHCKMRKKLFEKNA